MTHLSLSRPIDAARRRLLLTGTVWCAGGAGSSVLASETAAPALPRLGSPLPLTDVPLLEGGQFRAADARDRVVVLYYWASWCPFCAEQTPLMEQLWQAHRHRGLTVLGLSIDRTAEAAVQYRARKGYRFPSGLLTPEVARVLPKPRGLPVTLVRGRDGTAVAAESGQLFPEDVAQLSRFL